MRIPAVSAPTGPYVPDAAVSTIALMGFCRNTVAYDSFLGILLLLGAHEERGIFLFNTILLTLVLLLSCSVLPRHQAVKFPVKWKQFLWVPPNRFVIVARML